MKRTTAIFLAILMLGTFLAGCDKGSNDDVTSSPSASGLTESAPQDDTTGADISDSADSADSVTASSDTQSGDSQSSVPEATDTGSGNIDVVPSGTIRVLAIGNSFSTDCMQYLWQMLREAGYDEVILGNLYYGGCSLEEHLKFAKEDSPSYKYYKNTTGTWNSTANCKFSSALADEKWDCISFQQTSKTCGIAATYGKTLTDLVDIVASKVAPETKFMWNMTWAYQSDSTHTSFPRYERNQMLMYNMIVDCVKTEVMKDSRFSVIIPAGTAIQNARTSFMGDKLTRDGYHMDYNIGRYIVGLCWCSAISGVSPDRITYNPSTQKINADMIRAAKEAVANSISEPFAVTQSTVTSGEMPGGTVIDPSVILDPADFFEADKVVAAANGADLAKYSLLEWDYLENSYWNCTSKAGTTTPASSAGTYHQNVCSKEKYSITDIPVGTVFICDSDWQYRLEIYTSKDEKYTGTRPSMITAQFFALTDSFLNGCRYIAWNISSSPKSDISAIYAQAAAHLRIYVPAKEE